MLNRETNNLGQKAYQSTSKEDRSLPYRNWVRSNTLNGFFCDLDLVKWKRDGDKLIPCCLTEITRCDDETISPAYLKAIEVRYFEKELQGKVIETMSKLLGIPAYIVLYQKDFNWLKVYSFNKKVWKDFTEEEWAEYLRGL